LECPVCLSTFDDPVLLGECGHTFCRRCIEAVRAPLRCPTCRQAFTSRTILPNFALRALLREQGAPESSPPQVDASARSTQSGAESASLVRLSSSAGLGVDSLIASGVPAGLAKLIREEDSRIALRIFLLDNSGSTAHPDGQYLEEGPDGQMKTRKCTRWQEVVHTAMEQARWNVQLGTPCEFFLLNPLARSDTLEEGIDFQVIDGSKGDTAAQVQALETMLASTGPGGITPISDRLRKIHTRIAPQAQELARNVQKVVLVIVTDGLPTSTYSQRSGEADRNELVQELRRLSYGLPMHLVVRLCTNDDSVADFYNAIDDETELELEVVDDMESEAREIWRSGNRWLVYSPLIHRMREGGTLMKLFDLLDERLLDPMEVCLFCQLLLRVKPEDGPLPSEAYEFCAAVRERLPHTELIYDPLRREMIEPLRLSEVEWAVLPKGPLKRMCGDIGCRFM